MTIRYTKAASVAGGFAEAAFARQASQADVAADIVTAKAAVLAAANAAGRTNTDQRVDLDEQYSETFGCNVIRLRVRVW
jgi:hypothetical protein